MCVSPLVCFPAGTCGTVPHLSHRRTVRSRRTRDSGGRRSDRPRIGRRRPRRTRDRLSPDTA